MLSFDKKKIIFFDFLKEKDGSYGDKIRQEIEFYFDFLENDLTFLNRFNSREEIYRFTNMLISKIVMNDHQDSFDNIMIYYCR